MEAQIVGGLGHQRIERRVAGEADTPWRSICGCAFSSRPAATALRPVDGPPFAAAFALRTGNFVRFAIKKSRSVASANGSQCLIMPQEDEPERVLHCPACAGTMKLAKIVAKLGEFPRLMTFQCLTCDEFLTIESEE
jgi:hypothetical protein